MRRASTTRNHPLTSSLMPAGLARRAAIAALAAGCAKLPAATTPTRALPIEGLAAADSLPRLRTPDLKLSPAPEIHLERLPQDLRNASISISNQNVQKLSIALRPRAATQQSSKEVFEQVIAPLLRAAGFAKGASAFRMPPDGIPQPRANLAGAAQLLEKRYRSPSTKRNTALMMEALTGRAPESGVADERLALVGGMTVAQFRTDFERLVLLYPFGQMVDDVPIEHTALVASRRDGQTVSSVSGTLIHDYELTNERPPNNARALTSAVRALQQIRGLENSKPTLRGEKPVLVALPYGNAPSGRVALRYAWRLVLETQLSGEPASFLAWVDAQSGRMLKLEPLTAGVSAQGNGWLRDPGTGASVLQTFEVDSATDCHYQLRLADVSKRVDYKGDADDTNDVTIPSTGISSTTLANFDQPPINQGADAMCQSGENETFEQVNFFALLHGNRMQAVYNGVDTPFPASPWEPKIGASVCDATSNMYFGICTGYKDSSCPNYTTGGVPTANLSRSNYMDFAHDGTIVAHEVAHHAVARLTTLRPPQWCGDGPCQVPIGWSALHDLADAWADHIENTNCVGGWVAKNMGGTNYRKNCVGPDVNSPAEGRHFEDYWLPRRHELDVTFQPGTPRDHFPEHRSTTGDYADMQIAAAVLWQLREGMASKLSMSGSLVYFARLLAAIRKTGMSAVTPPDSDVGIYAYLQDLEHQLMQQWADGGMAGDSTANKVLAAFARGGLFALPPLCLDSSAATLDTKFCPSGESGADAVVDIDDNEPGDDTLVDAVRHIESDFLELGGPAPTFHVWTGSRFKFAASGAATIAGISPCNARFLVEASTDPAFPAGQTASSGWAAADVDSSVIDGKECYGTWTPSETDWATLQAKGAPSAIYYRARTSNAEGGNLRDSTLPGNGFWSVPPPYALLTADGVSDF